MKRFFLLVFGFIVLHSIAFSQNDSLPVSTIVQKHRIAIFAPLYLDSAFDGNNEYRYTKNVFPKFINPGLEFYEGAQLAIDSLSKEDLELEYFVYDTRSAKETVEQQLAKEEMQTAELIIAHCSGNEVRLFSDFARSKNIPFINTTVPNDAGITDNPYFVILNPTLKTQCEGIYRYLQKYYSIDPIIIFNRKGPSNEMIKSIFDEYSKVTMSVPLKLKYVTLSDSFTVTQLQSYLDSNHKTLCMSGSLDVNFGRRLVVQLAGLSKRYQTVVMGMPTWDAISKDFSRPEFKGIEIIYSTPFYNAKMDKVSQSINNYFTNEMYARPSDMVFRGYEVTWKLSKLLMHYGKDLSSNLASKQYQVFTEYDIQPVISRQTNTLEYFENKKLYFIKWQDGIIKSAN